MAESWKEWEADAVALHSVRDWAASWLCEETQHAFLVGVDDLKASAGRAIEAAALELGWWQDASGEWRKPVVPGLF